MEVAMQLINAGISGDTNVLKGVLKEALAAQGLSETDDLTLEQQAAILNDAMRITIVGRQAYTGAMNGVALVAYRTGLWELAEVDGVHPDTFRDWLQMFDMSAAWVSRLNSAIQRVSWLEDNGIDAKHLLSANKISHLQAALPDLRSAEQEGDLERAAELVEMVTRAKNRQAVRTQLAEPNETLGDYVRVNVDQNGTVQALIVQGTPENLTTILRKLGGELNNDLPVGTARVSPEVLEVQLYAD